VTEVAGARSFEEYRRRIADCAQATSHATALSFCNWVLARFPAVFGPLVWDGLDPSELSRFREIIGVLNDVASGGSPLSPAVAAELQIELLALGPTDDVDRIEVEPDATEFQDAVWTFLEYLRTGDRAHVCAMSEHLINSRDHHLASSARGSTDLETLFTTPELRDEAALHEALLNPHQG
jgi:hypothetical protein